MLKTMSDFKATELVSVHHIDQNLYSKMSVAFKVTMLEATESLYYCSCRSKGFLKPTFWNRDQAKYMRDLRKSVLIPHSFPQTSPTQNPQDWPQPRAISKTQILHHNKKSCPRICKTVSHWP